MAAEAVVIYYQAENNTFLDVHVCLFGIHIDKCLFCMS